MNIITTDITDIEANNAVGGGEITLESGEVLTFYPLVDHLLISKFQLYNRSRQKLTGTIKSLAGVIPFQLMKDSKQSDKPFVITGFTDNVLSDMYEIEMNEYDNTLIG
jgi:hypothetical protein